MPNHSLKKRDKWNYLAPYPEASEEQVKLVRRVELFASIILGIIKVVNFLLMPVFFVISLIEKIFSKNKSNSNFLESEQHLLAPEEEAIYVANSTQAMDHNFFYILKQGRIWLKPIAAPLHSQWMLLDKTGLPPSGNKLTSISSDGVNLIAIDESGAVNYVHTDSINFVVTDDNWQIKDIKLDWTDWWFSVPIIGWIVGLFRGHQLKLPNNCHSYAISQKGPETAYYTDISGKIQPEFLVGVTTLYALTEEGRIFFADPWLGNQFQNEITAPKDGQFVAETIAASASTIFLLRRDDNGKPCMYTRFIDFDSVGSNPFLPASYGPDNNFPLVRRLPAEDWLKQPEIILEHQAKLTSKISILQIGRGQNNRQLRVEGTNSNGEAGYYFKGIYEKEWEFAPTPGVHLKFKESVSLSTPPPPPVDFKLKKFTAKKQIPLSSVEVKKFLRHGLNERGLHTVLELTLKNGYKLTLPLYARRGLTHLFGASNNEPYWNLIIPKEYREHSDPQVKELVKELFNNKSHCSVSINEFENGEIEIVDSNKKFKFELNTMIQSDELSLPINSVKTIYQKHKETLTPKNSNKNNLSVLKNRSKEENVDQNSDNRGVPSNFTDPYQNTNKFFSNMDLSKEEISSILDFGQNCM